MISGRGRTLWAATASGVAGVGFGLPCVVGIRHLANTGEVWQFLGFPTYGDGPFESVGITTTVALLAGFLAVCVVEAVLALAIAHRSTWAAKASAALLPIEVAYWIGFALPVGFVLGAARFVLLSPPHKACPTAPDASPTASARREDPALEPPPLSNDFSMLRKTTGDKASGPTTRPGDDNGRDRQRSRSRHTSCSVLGAPLPLHALTPDPRSPAAWMA